MTGIGENTVRVGTALLSKCRMMLDVWPHISEEQPDLKLEITSIAECQDSDVRFSQLGQKFDLMEGVYCTAWDNQCGFYKLTDTSICCAVSKNHHLVDKDKLSLADLAEECVVMPRRGLSREMDAFRENLLNTCHNVHIMDSSYYGVDTFTMCALNPYLLHFRVLAGGVVFQHEDKALPQPVAGLVKILDQLHPAAQVPHIPAGKVLVHVDGPAGIK